MWGGKLGEGRDVVVVCVCEDFDEVGGRGDLCFIWCRGEWCGWCVGGVCVCVCVCGVGSLCVLPCTLYEVCSNIVHVVLASDPQTGSDPGLCSGSLITSKSPGVIIMSPLIEAPNGMACVGAGCLGCGDMVCAVGVGCL